jgi:hypothetical protein
MARVGAAETRAGEREEALPAQAMGAGGWWEVAAWRGEWEEAGGGGGRRRRGGGRNGRRQARWGLVGIYLARVRQGLSGSAG